MTSLGCGDESFVIKKLIRMVIAAESDYEFWNSILI